jgi:hypothetical protein
VAAPAVADISQKKFSNRNKYKACPKTTSSSKLPEQRQLLVVLVALAT